MGVCSSTGFRAALIVVASLMAAGAVGAAEDPAAVSPDGLTRASAPAGCRCVLVSVRSGPDAPWGEPKRLFETRGAVGRLVFAPDGRRIAFENRRADLTMNSGGASFMPGYSPVRAYAWGFIGVADLDGGPIRWIDPEFASDTDPVWSGDGRSIRFLRHVQGGADQRLVRPAPPRPGPAPAAAAGSLASYLAAPLALEPEASADGRTLAWATREGQSRAIYVASADGGPARRRIAFGGDDGQPLTELSLSQDGRLLAFVRGERANKQGDSPNPNSTPVKPVHEVWLAATGSDSPPLRVDAGDGPRFTPDGASLIWSTAEGLRSAPVLFTSASLGLAPSTLLVAGAVEAAVISPDGGRIAVERDGGLLVLRLADLKLDPVNRPAGSEDTAPAFSPDGRALAFIRLPTAAPRTYTIGWTGPFVSEQPWAIEAVDLESGAQRQVWTARAGAGSVFYNLDPDPTEAGHRGDQLFWTANDLIVFPWEGDGWRHLWAAPASGSGQAVLLTPGQGEVETAALSLDRRQLLVSTNIGDPGRRHIAQVDPEAVAMRPLTSGERDQWGATPLASGAAWIEAGWSEPPHVMLAAAAGASHPIATPGLAAAAPPPAAFVQPRLVSFPGEDGAAAYGQLFVPRRASGCGVIFAHGGIKRQMLPGFHYMQVYAHLYEVNQYLVSRGCTVLSVEYRSSIMRGSAFRNAEGWGTAGASEMKDVIGAANWLKSRPGLKVKRLGIWGLSWGGYITAQALARRSDLFQAGFDLAGVHEFDGTAVANAPEALVDRWRSPVFLIQGDDDRNVDFQQGLSLAALLRARGVEHEFHVVPDEVHDLTSTWAIMTSSYGAGADWLANRLGATPTRPR